MLIVAMTSIPSRIGQLWPVLASLEEQTRRPDIFSLFLPNKCGREDRDYVFPDWFGPFAKNVIRVGRDWGPSTKLVPVLDRVRPGDTVVTLDDDVAYEPHTLEELEAGSRAHPASAVGFCGVRNGTYFHAEFVGEPTSVSVLGGYRGIAYSSQILDRSILDDVEALIRDGVFTLDDHAFSWNLNRRGIMRLVIPTKWKENGINCKMYRLGNGVYDEGPNRALVDSSIGRIRKLYESNQWPMPE